MKKIIASLVLTIMALNMVLGLTTANAVTENEIDIESIKMENKQLPKELRLLRKHNVINLVAKEYYANREKIEFSQKKRQLNVRPEKAKYLDSSSFVHNIYRQAFGVKIKTRTAEFIAEAKKECKAEYKNNIKENDEHIICYVDNINKVKGNINKLNDILEIGDLIVWREKKNNKEYGYIVMYMGNGKIIRCTNTKPAIRKEKISKLINSKGKIYLGRKEVKKFAVIRPINAKYMKNVTETRYSMALLKNALEKYREKMRALQNEVEE